MLTDDATNGWHDNADGIYLATLPLLLRVGIILVEFFLFQQWDFQPSRESPLEIFKRRYARGEIEATEKDTIKRHTMED